MRALTRAPSTSPDGGTSLTRVLWLPGAFGRLGFQVRFPPFYFIYTAISYEFFTKEQRHSRQSPPNNPREPHNTTATRLSYDFSFIGPLQVTLNYDHEE
jgi:hypothetical protein